MPILSCVLVELVKVQGLPAVQTRRLLPTLTIGRDLDAMLRTDARPCGCLPCALLGPPWRGVHPGICCSWQLLHNRWKVRVCLVDPACLPGPRILCSSFQGHALRTCGTVIRTAIQRALCALGSQTDG